MTTEAIATENLDGPSLPSTTESLLVDQFPHVQGADMAGAGGALIGECIDARHPTVYGRVQIRWEDGEVHEKWLPTLHRITVREADRVLLIRPANWPEPVVVGVVDGFAMRPRPEQVPGPSLSIENDESLRVMSVEGEQLLEIYQKESGPVVRLLRDDVDVELKGELRLSAKSIEMNARRGEVKVWATDDVKIDGEQILMNCEDAYNRKEYLEKIRRKRNRE